MANAIVNRLDVERTSAPMILIIGQTGAGKSHFCNKVVGEDVECLKESAHLSSCERELPHVRTEGVRRRLANVVQGTAKPELLPVQVDGIEYLLVDTPGFNDTTRDFKRSDARVLGEIAQTLTLQTELGINLVGV